MLMQLLDVDYFLNNTKPVLRLFGKTESNKSVCCLYDKFLPYFYVRKTDENIKKAEDLNLSFVEEAKFLPTGYSEEPINVLKIILNDPHTVPKIRDLFKESFDSDVLFKYRFMIDMGLRGMGWYNIDGNPVKTHAAKVPTYEIKSIKPEDRQAILFYVVSCDIQTIELRVKLSSDAFSHLKQGNNNQYRNQDVRQVIQLAFSYTNFKPFCKVKNLHK